MSFIIKYICDNGYNLHDSYVELISDYVDKHIRNKLKKIGYSNNRFLVAIGYKTPVYIERFSAIRCRIFDLDRPKLIKPVGKTDTESTDTSFDKWIGYIDIDLIDTSWNMTAERGLNGSQYDFSLPVGDKKFKIRLDAQMLYPPRHVLEQQMEEESAKTMERLKKACSFPFELNCNWPDVTVRIISDHIVDDGQRKNALSSITNFVRKWNRRQRSTREAYIHDVSLAIGKFPENEVVLQLDFGEAETSVLPGLLKALDKLPVNIVKVIFC